VTLVLLAVVFAGPTVAIVVGARSGIWLAVGLGAAAWVACSASYVATIRLYGISPAWCLALPAAGLLYGAMTLDSAIAHARGARGVW
jgi:hypothetical protein